MILFPNAKINLGLHVINKRSDGFHNIETVFYPIALCDALEIVPARDGRFGFTSSGLPIPGDPASNLCLKACNLLLPEILKHCHCERSEAAGFQIRDLPERSEAAGFQIRDLPERSETAGFQIRDLPERSETAGFQIRDLPERSEAASIAVDTWKQPLKIHLHKVIPMGSGLGGGSSDGTFTLLLLNDLLNLSLPKNKLIDFARKLGSDCAFFIQNSPVFATGRGDSFMPIQVDLSGYTLLLVIPNVHVSTSEAYSLVNPSRHENRIREIIAQPVSSWKENLINDFEAPVTGKYPVIGEIKRKLYDSGALYAAMSGSGSAVFGIFNPDTEKSFTFPGCFVWKSTANLQSNC